MSEATSQPDPIGLRRQVARLELAIAEVNLGAVRKVCQTMDWVAYGQLVANNPDLALLRGLPATHLKSGADNRRFQQQAMGALTAAGWQPLAEPVLWDTLAQDAGLAETLARLCKLGLRFQDDELLQMVVRQDPPEPSTVTACLRAGLDPNAVDARGDNVLVRMLRIYRDGAGLEDGIDLKLIDTLRILVEAGGNIRQANASGDTAERILMEEILPVVTEEEEALLLRTFRWALARRQLGGEPAVDTERVLDGKPMAVPAWVDPGQGDLVRTLMARSLLLDQQQICLRVRAWLQENPTLHGRIRAETVETDPDFMSVSIELDGKPVESDYSGRSKPMRACVELDNALDSRCTFQVCNLMQSLFDHLNKTSWRVEHADTAIAMAMQEHAGMPAEQVAAWLGRVDARQEERDMGPYTLPGERLAWWERRELEGVQQQLRLLTKIQLNHDLTQWLDAHPDWQTAATISYTDVDEGIDFVVHERAGMTETEQDGAWQLAWILNRYGPRQERDLCRYSNNLSDLFCHMGWRLANADGAIAQAMEEYCQQDWHAMKAEAARAKLDATTAAAGAISRQTARL